MVYFWIENEQHYISEILTQWGLCITFNIAFSHDLMKLNSTSCDFHYHNTIRNIGPKNYWHDPPPTELPKNISTSKAGLWVGLIREKVKNKEFIGRKFDGYTVLFHNPFEIPSKNSKVINFNPNLQTKVLIRPQMNMIDQSLVGYEPNE